MAVVFGSSTAAVQLTQIVSTGLISQQNLPANISQAIQYTNGTGAGQIDLLYAKSLSLAGSATTLDVTAIADLSGATVNMARVRFIWVFNTATTAGYTVAVGGAASNPLSGFLGTTGLATVYPGTTTNYGRLVLEDATSVGGSVGVVTSGSNKAIKLDPGANTIAVYVVIGGCSATS